jgi:hypothetical protein
VCVYWMDVPIIFIAIYSGASFFLVHRVGRPLIRSHSFVLDLDLHMRFGYAVAFLLLDSIGCLCSNTWGFSKDVLYRHTYSSLL